MMDLCPGLFPHPTALSLPADGIIEPTPYVKGVSTCIERGGALTEDMDLKDSTFEKFNSSPLQLLERSCQGLTRGRRKRGDMM